MYFDIDRYENKRTQIWMYRIMLYAYYAVILEYLAFISVQLQGTI